MATRTFVVKSGDTWEWEETPKFQKALAKYWKTVTDNIKLVKDQADLPNT